MSTLTVPGAKGHVGAAERRPARHASRPIEVQLVIPDLHCWECVGHLELALEAVPGVQTATIDWPSGAARIAFHPDAISLEQIVSGLHATGYEAKRTLLLELD